MVPLGVVSLECPFGSTIFLNFEQATFSIPNFEKKTTNCKILIFFEIFSKMSVSILVLVILYAI
jgi:hypothetical protein